MGSQPLRCRRLGLRLRACGSACCIRGWQLLHRLVRSSRILDCIRRSAQCCCCLWPLSSCWLQHWLLSCAHSGSGRGRRAFRLHGAASAAVVGVHGVAWPAGCCCAGLRWRGADAQAGPAWWAGCCCCCWCCGCCGWRSRGSGCCWPPRAATAAAAARLVARLLLGAGWRACSACCNKQCKRFVCADGLHAEKAGASAASVHGIMLFRISQF